MPATEKSPRLIRRGDVIHSKDSDRDEVVRGVSFVFQLADGSSVSYSVDETVTMGHDGDISPAEFAEAVQIEAAERAEWATATEPVKPA